MSLRLLEEQKRIKKITLDPTYIRNQLEIADHALASANRLLEEDPDYSYTRAYTAMLASGRAFMCSLGYIPDGTEKHLSVKLFLEQYLDRQMITKFDVARRKRHTLEYDQIGIISPTDAVNAVATAEDFVKLIKSKIDSKNSPAR